MRSKSARCWLSLSAKVFVPALVLGAPLAAQAMSVTVTSKGGVAPDGKVWYAGAYQDPSALFTIDSNAGGPYPFQALDLTQSQAKENGSFANAIEFEVYSTKTVTGLQPGQQLALVVSTANSTGSSATQPVAIAGFNSTFCGTSLNCKLGINQVVSDPSPAGGSSTTYYFAIPYTTGSRVRLELYPRDICTSYYVLQGTNAGGCATDSTQSSHYTAQTTGTPLSLTFQVQVVDSNFNLPSRAPLPTPQDSATLNLYFEASGRTVPSCPSPDVKYFPGDTRIFADLSGFSPDVQSTPSGFAPITNVIVVGKKNNGALDTSSSLADDVVSRVGTSANETVTGFENVTSPNDTERTYNVGFLPRDAAGVFYVPGSGSACAINGIRTSQIQGFLSKSNCFIATAAFRSIDSAPVTMLRRFRDQVLFKTDLGTSFVHWYYGWSPGAAEWLMTHPAFRYPVLQALIPVEAAAWVLLHPAQFAAYVFFGASLLAIWTAFAILREMTRRTR